MLLTMGSHSESAVRQAVDALLDRDAELAQEVKQGDQILSKLSGSQPLERLDAVRNDAFPAREQPAAHYIQGKVGASAKALTTTWAT